MLLKTDGFMMVFRFVGVAPHGIAVPLDVDQVFHSATRMHRVHMSACFATILGEIFPRPIITGCAVSRGLGLQTADHVVGFPRRTYVRTFPMIWHDLSSPETPGWTVLKSTPKPGAQLIPSGAQTEIGLPPPRGRACRHLRRQARIAVGVVRRAR